MLRGGPALHGCSSHRLSQKEQLAFSLETESETISLQPAAELHHLLARGASDRPRGASISPDFSKEREAPFDTAACKDDDVGVLW